MSLLDMSALKTLLPAVETAINKALAMDPGSPEKLKPLNGCILEVNITSLRQSFFFSVQDQKVVLLDADTPPTVTLSGTSMGLIKLALQKEKNILFRRKEVSLTGDAVRAQQIQNFMKKLEVDWEALLAEAIGDVPAHLLTQGLQSGLTWGRHLSQSLSHDIEEFIKYELRLLPSKAKARAQFDAIDQLRLATDRLEARVKKLVSSKAKRKEPCQN